MAATWQSIVKSVAPEIGTALGGPMAGAATHFLADKLLGKSDASVADIEHSVQNASPEDLAKLKALDAQFKSEMQRLKIDVKRLEKGGDKSERMFKEALWPQVLFSIILLVGYFLVLYFLVVNPDTLSKDRGIMGVFTTVLGVLTAAIPQILSYWFGAGSAKSK